MWLEGTCLSEAFCLLKGRQIIVSLLFPLPILLSLMWRDAPIQCQVHGGSCVVSIKKRPHCTFFFLLTNSVFFQIHTSPRESCVIRKREINESKKKSSQIIPISLKYGHIQWKLVQVCAFQEGRGLSPDVNS